MKLLRWLFVAQLLGTAGAAFAGYASAIPPAGFSGSAAAGWAYKAAANETITAAQTVRTSATLNVGGRIVTMPATMKFAANASTYAARFMFTSPLVLGATIAIPFALDWANQKGFFLEEGIWKKNTPSACESDGSGCWVYVCNVNGASFATRGSMQTACADAAIAKASQDNNNNPSITRNGTTTDDMGGTLTTPARFTWSDGFTMTTTHQTTYTKVPGQPSGGDKVPVTQAEFEEGLGPLPMPSGLPAELPTPLPVELPKVYPDTFPNPVAIPLGAPVPVPGTTPQQYKQPVVDVRPLPTLGDPWRVDLNPRDETGTDPNGVPEPTEGGQVAAPPEEQIDLCKEHPDIAACKPLGPPKAAPAVPNTPKAVPLEKQSGFGPANAACPAPRQATLSSGFVIALPFDALCQFADGIRPVLIGLAWLTAALTWLGLARKES